MKIRIFSAWFLFGILALAVFSASCGESRRPGAPGTPGNPTPPGSNPPPPAAPSQGGFAAGIGGAGQNSAAHFLVVSQVPGTTPFPTVIGSSGTLTAAKASTNPNQPFNAMAIDGAIDPSGKFFYQAAWPGLNAFTIDRNTGNLTEMPNSPYEPSQNFDGVAVDQLGKFVYGYANGQIFAFSIQAGTGQLTPIAGSPFPAAASAQVTAFAVGGLAVSQDDKFLFVGTTSGILGYAIDATTGALTVVPGSPFGGSAGQAFAIVAPASGFLYEATQGGKTPIYGYKIDPSSGALSAIPGSPFGSDCSTSNLTSPASGKFLFAANCGMYQIDATSGALSFLFADPLAPNSFWAVFDPASEFVWELSSQEPCFHCDMGVTTFQVDPNTARMTEVPNSFLFITNSEVGAVSSMAITQ